MFYKFLLTVSACTCCGLSVYIGQEICGSQFSHSTTWASWITLKSRSGGMHQTDHFTVPNVSVFMQGFFFFSNKHIKSRMKTS